MTSGQHCENRSSKLDLFDYGLTSYTGPFLARYYLLNPTVCKPDKCAVQMDVATVVVMVDI